MVVCMNMQKAGMIFPFPKKKITTDKSKESTFYSIY
jgi:hypothetical protein